MENTPDNKNNTYAVKDFNTEGPRWCPGCGDFGIIAALKQFWVAQQIPPHEIVNISGIGCSSRAPFYFNTYGLQTLHGRAIPVATGLALTRPDLKLFIHSGDGDAVSIGCGHLVHGINKNFNCVFLMYDNELYSLTKNQSSPTTRKGFKTNTQPSGTFMDPIHPVSLAIGVGGSFVASTASWMPDHIKSTLEAAYHHKGFSFVHIAQKCPHFDADNFDTASSEWFSFLTHEDGIPPDARIADKTEIITHDPANIKDAFDYASRERCYFGLFYRDKDKVRYEETLQGFVKNAEQKSRSEILDIFKI